MSIKKSLLYNVVCGILFLLPWSVYPWYFKFKPNPVNVPVQSSVPIVTIVLVPAGDARSQGRSLEHQFESSSAMSYAQDVKMALEKKYPEIRVLISHKVGDIVRQYQIPTMANTVGVDLVLTVNCYHERGPKPELYIYQFSYGEDFVSKVTDLHWYFMSSAYLFSKSTTRAWAPLLVQGLNGASYKSLFTVKGPYAMPFEPLIGIKVPAIGLEMSLKRDDDWSVFTDPLVASLDPIVGQLIKQRAPLEVA